MKLVAESLYEFERSGDPKRAMGLGMDEQIRKFVESKGYLIPDGNRNESYKKREPLWVCSKFGMTDFVNHLLMAGADPRANDSAALRHACGHGFEEIVAMLLDAGANPAAQGTSYDECFKWAGRNGHDGVVDLLNRSIRGEKFSKEEIKSKPETQKIVKDAIQKNTEEPELEPEEEKKGGWI